MQYSTSEHPSRNAPDAGTTSAQNPRHSSSSPTGSSELAGLKVKLHESLRQFPNFPTPGILFEDILPIFADAHLHQSLIHALELFVGNILEPSKRPDIIIGLEARGFLFGPSLALRLGAGFVPVRKQGKLPGPTETAGYEKEYGQDLFQIQSDGIKSGQKVLIVDDIVATGKLVRHSRTQSPLLNHLGGSAAAAGELVKRLGGNIIGYVFILELDFLKGREKLNAPVHTLLSSQEESQSNPS